MEVRRYSESILSAFYIQLSSKSSRLGLRFEIFGSVEGKEVERDGNRKNPSGPNPIGNRHPPAIEG